MKKRSNFFLAIFLCSLLLASCGGRESGKTEENGENGETGENGKTDAPAWSGVTPGMEDLKELTERSEYYDIITESTEFTRSEQMTFNSNGDYCSYRDTVLYGEEAVQIWEAPRLDRTVDIWLYRADESWEQLLSGISREYISDYTRNWYLDSEGNSYCWNNLIESVHANGGGEVLKAQMLTKFLPSGEVQFTREWDSEDFLYGMCQLGDGKIYLDLMDSEGIRFLAEMDPVTGETPEEKKLELEDAYQYAEVGSGPEMPLLFHMDRIAGNEILALSLKDGTASRLLSFTGTSYANVYPQLNLKDFKMLPDGSFLMLYTEDRQPQAVLDKLTVSKVEKTPVILRGQFHGNTWISAQAARFNRQSEKYHVIVEDCGTGNDQEDFARLTSVQIAAGKGPDIISGELMRDYIWGMIKNGALEDLSPYLEESGLREEDYLPCAFGLWREGDQIYGVTPRIQWMVSYIMDASLLGEKELDIGELIEALLSAQRTDAVFMAGSNSQDLLDYFLGGSETLWGMVDWEEGTCDFSGKLLADILEVAALYGDSSQNANVSGIAESRMNGPFFDLFTFQGSKEMEEAGKVVCGSLFDDGCHLQLFALGTTMAINSASKNKDGAWEFMRFLFSEEIQLSESSHVPPVRKDSLDTWLEAQLEEARSKTSGQWEKDANGEDIWAVYPSPDEYNTEEKAAEFKRELEEARAFPLRTGQILKFIQEEAEDYFNGSKTAAEVARVIEKRVQVYLDENR